MLQSIDGKEVTRDIDNIERVCQNLHEQFEGKFHEEDFNQTDETYVAVVESRRQYLGGQLSNVYENNREYIDCVCVTWFLLKCVNQQCALNTTNRNPNLDYDVANNLSLAILTFVFLSIHASADDEIRLSRCVSLTKIDHIYYSDDLYLHKSRGFQRLSCHFLEKF